MSLQALSQKNRRATADSKLTRCLAPQGTAACRKNCPSLGKLRHKPEHMSFQIAAGLTTTYGTSYYALKQRGNLAKGETPLVPGAGGLV